MIEHSPQIFTSEEKAITSIKCRTIVLSCLSIDTCFFLAGLHAVTRWVSGGLRDV